MLREPLRRPPEFGKPVIVPTLGFSVGIRSVKNHPELASSSFDAWLGVRMHPFSATMTPFVAVGLEVDTRQYTEPTRDLDPEPTERESDTWTEIVPEMRVGWAFIGKPTTDYFNQVFPYVELYGIAGYRIPNGRDGGGARLGVGVSAPIVMLLGLMCEFPLPAQLELLMDVDSFQNGRRDYIVRFGWHF